MNEYRLEQLFDLQMGKTPSRNESSYWLNGLHDWISIKDLSNSSKYISETNEKLSDIAVKESGIRIIPKDTVIMSFKLSIGKVAITSHDMYSNEAIMAFHDKKVVEILPEYLYYLLLATNWDEGSNKAVMGITLNKTTLSMIKIRMHDIVNQVQITSVLDNLDKQINNKKKQITEYDQLIKSRFVEMFGDDLKGKTIRLGDLSEVITKGTTPTTLGFDFVDEGINFVKIECITDNYQFLKEKMLHITSDCDEKLKRSRLKDNDVLFSIAGAIGRTAIVTKDILPANTNQALAIIRLKEKSGLNVEFLNEMLHTELIQEQVSKKAMGVAQINLSLTDIANLNVIVPSLNRQQDFSNFVKQVDKLKFEYLI